MYLALDEQERHFNDLESRYRTLASTWLLATFAALGFLATKKTDAISVSPLLVMSFVAFCGGAGIVLLWNLDLMVYHRLLDASFIAGIELERANPWLPKSHLGMLEAASNSGGVLRRIVYFYACSISFLFVLAGAFLVGWMARHGLVASMVVAVVSVLLSVGVGVLIWFQTMGAGRTQWQRVLRNDETP